MKIHGFFIQSEGSSTKLDEELTLNWLQLAGCACTITVLEVWYQWKALHHPTCIHSDAWAHQSKYAVYRLAEVQRDDGKGSGSGRGSGYSISIAIAILYPSVQVWSINTIDFQLLAQRGASNFTPLREVSSSLFIQSGSEEAISAPMHHSTESCLGLGCLYMLL